MNTLEIQHPEVYHHFINGYHSIWRSEREWAGLSPDHVIESVLMRSLKTSGGLTRGRGMSEQQRAIWALSMPACASVNSSMQEITGVQGATSEQHQELSPSRTSRDWKDTFILIQYLQDRNPFVCGEKLCNISNGVHAQAAVNVDECKMIGSKIIAKMEGLQPSEHTFKRKDQAVPVMAAVAVRKKVVSIGHFSPCFCLQLLKFFLLVKSKAIACIDCTENQRKKELSQMS